MWIVRRCADLLHGHMFPIVIALFSAAAIGMGGMFWHVSRIPPAFAAALGMLGLAGLVLVVVRLQHASVGLKRHAVELQKLNEALSSEIAQRRAAEQRLRHDALHDALTGLPNRTLLIDRIQRCIERRKRDPGLVFAVLFLDLDGFKVINDSLGHVAGDTLLVEVARRLISCLRGLDSVARSVEDTSARIGGDEFVVLLEGLAAPADATLVAERLQERLAEPLDVDGHEIVSTTSIGIAISQSGYGRADEILRDADTALYQAKSRGKARCVLFEKRMRAQAIARLQIETDLRAAIQHGDLFLQYQPIVSLANGEIVGFEALVRWRHPERGTIQPLDFIPIAEETGLIVPMGKWVLREACGRARDWQIKFANYADLGISVNLSSRQFSAGGLPGEVDRILAETGLQPRCLNLEVTESIVMEQGGVTASVIREFQIRDLDLHLDDFGTGYSSLSYLHHLPVAALKVDKSFVRQIATDPKAAATVRAVLVLAHSRDLKVIAEGVETVEQLKELQLLECDLAQGFYFAKPADPDDVETMLASGAAWRRTA